MTGSEESQLPVVSPKVGEGLKEPISLDHAREILIDIVNVPADLATDQSIAGYSADDIREAVTSVARDVLGKRFGIRRNKIEKFPGDGKRASLTIDKSHIWFTYEDIKCKPGYENNPDVGRRAVQMIFPIISQFSAGQTQFQYMDNRKYTPGYPNTQEYASTHVLFKGHEDQKPHQFKILLKGLKWLSSNLLNWRSGEFVVPEAHNGHSLTNLKALPAVK